MLLYRNSCLLDFYIQALCYKKQNKKNPEDLFVDIVK